MPDFEIVFFQRQEFKNNLRSIDLLREDDYYKIADYFK